MNLRKNNHHFVEVSGEPNQHVKISHTRVTSAEGQRVDDPDSDRHVVVESVVFNYNLLTIIHLDKPELSFT